MTDKPEPTEAVQLSDPLLNLNDLIAMKVVGSRTGMETALSNGWLPQPIRWPNGRMFWRKSAIEQVVVKIEGTTFAATGVVA